MQGNVGNATQNSYNLLRKEVSTWHSAPVGIVDNVYCTQMSNIEQQSETILSDINVLPGILLHYIDDKMKKILSLQWASGLVTI